MHNPVTGSGGMLIGVVEEVGPGVPAGPECRGPDRHPGVADADPAARSTTTCAGWDGRGEQVPAEGHAILFARSIAAVLPDDLPPRWPGGHGRLRRPGPHPPRGRRAHRRPRRGGDRRRRQERIAGTGRGAPRRRRADHRASSRSRRRGARACAPPAWPTRSCSPTRATRWRVAAVGRRRAGRPTSPSSAWTCPAASTARSWPRRRAARSSSSRWPPRSRPRPSAPKAWPPT